MSSHELCVIRHVEDCGWPSLPIVIYFVSSLAIAFCTGFFVTWLRATNAWSI